MRIYIILLAAILAVNVSFSQSRIENLGSNINTKNAEIRPVLSFDGKTLYFVVENNTSSKNSPKNQAAQEIWCSELSADGSWAKAVKCSDPLNSSKKDNAIFWSSIDGSKILIRGSYENGKYIGRGFSFCTKTSTGWSTPQPIKIKGYNNLSVDKYDGAYLTNDGKTMLFYLSEEKNSWLNDIYVSQQESENVWSTPQKIINDSISIDDYDEISPYVAADGVAMYFSSDRPGGHGGYDIWMTKRLDDTWLHWTSPVNMGDSINSNQWEAYFSMDAKAEYGYFATTRNSLGSIDLCKIKLTENQKPKSVTLLQGKVYNAENNVVLSNITITSETEETNSSVIIPIENEVFKTILPFGHKYTIKAKGEGFEDLIETIDLSVIAPYQEMHKDLFIHPIKKEIVDSAVAKDSSLSENTDQTKITDKKEEVTDKKKKKKVENPVLVNENDGAVLEKKDNKSQTKKNTKEKVEKSEETTIEKDQNNSGKQKNKSKTHKGNSKADEKKVDEKSSSDLTQNEVEKEEKPTKSKKKKVVQNNDTELQNKDVAQQDNVQNDNKTIDEVKNDEVENGDVFTVNNILFDFAKSDLKKSSYKELNKVVKFLKKNKEVKIELSAHTDNVGSDKYNLNLSKSRAKTSRKYLISKGVSSNRISSKGFGERKPVASNKTARGRKQNRRVEIKILSGE